MVQAGDDGMKQVEDEALMGLKGAAGMDTSREAMHQVLGHERDLILARCLRISTCTAKLMQHGRSLDTHLLCRVCALPCFVCSCIHPTGSCCVAVIYAIACYFYCGLPVACQPCGWMQRCSLVHMDVCKAKDTCCTAASHAPAHMPVPQRFG